ncbi:MAG: DNA-directed RNA polymerase subunit omega [Acidobacteriota bacterium]|nr:DNA-directed RNA polymerase subunit omega [Acidobacteriota bacterium]
MVEQTENNIDAETEETSENKPIPAIDSKYRMIILAAQRSKQLQRGATPRVEADMRKQKPTRVAMREIKGEKINFELLEVKL